MKALRSIAGVIAGYAIFVITSVALFELSGQPAHEEASWSFVALTFAYGAFFSLISGMVAQWISGTKNRWVSYSLAIILAGFAAFSMFSSEGSHWTQILAIFVFAPATIIGGWRYIKKSKA